MKGKIVYQIMLDEPIGNETALAVCADPNGTESIETQLLQEVFGHPEACFGSVQEGNTSSIEFDSGGAVAHVVSKGGSRELTLEMRAWTAPGEEPEKGSCNQGVVQKVDEGIWKATYLTGNKGNEEIAGYDYFDDIAKALRSVERAAEGCRTCKPILLGLLG